MKELIKKLWYTLSGTTDDEKSETAEEETTKKTEKTKKTRPPAADNIVDVRQKTINLLVEFFNFSFGEESLSGNYVVWVSNKKPQLQSMVRKVDFMNSLQLELENGQLWAASKAEIIFKTENPPQDAGFKELKDDENKESGIFIQWIEENEPTVVMPRAKLFISNNKGSLVKEEYLLDASKQTEYNIGSNREANKNHIEIDFYDEQNENNERVSLVHAKIVFVADRGFYLQSRNEKNRTIINRDNQRIADLTDLNSQVLLKNNDEIELAKSVCLRFEVID